MRFRRGWDGDRPKKKGLLHLGISENKKEDAVFVRIFSRSLCLYRYLAPPCTSNHIKVENLRNFRRFSSFVLNFVFYFHFSYH